MPVFQNVTYEDQAHAINCIKGNIELVQNTVNGLVYNRLFDPSLVKYDKNYQNEQSLSKFFLKHLESVERIVSKHLGKDSLIEIGCGKGFFLEMLLSKGFDIVGFDKAYEGNNPKIIKDYFTSNSGFKGKGLILRHVLEHIQNPVKFLNDLKNYNNNEGLVYIEVPCLDWIIKNKAWFDICYEHVNYFRLSDLKSMFGSVIDCGSFFGNGQYIYIVADLSKLKKDIKYNEAVKFPDDFASNLPKTKTKALDVVWGASTKGVIYSILASRQGFKFNFVIDINPVKQGRYLPETGLKVLSPQNLIDDYKDNVNIYIMNSNYYEEIVELTNNNYNYIVVEENNL